MTYSCKVYWLCATFTYLFFQEGCKSVAIIHKTWVYQGKFPRTAVDDAQLWVGAVIINNLKIALHLSQLTECKTS